MFLDSVLSSPPDTNVFQDGNQALEGGDKALGRGDLGELLGLGEVSALIK